jgi:small GTP-binding protein
MPKIKTFEGKDVYKICLLGDSGVGKRSLLDRFLENRFYSYEGAKYLHPNMRLRGTFFPKSLYVNEEEIIVQLWPPPRPITLLNFVAQTFFNRVHGLILVYDITYDKSLYNLEGWIEKYKEYAETLDVPMILVGCKAEIDETRLVSKDEALEFAKKHDLQIDDIIECSAKTGENIKLVFVTIAKKIIEKN